MSFASGQFDHRLPAIQVRLRIMSACGKSNGQHYDEVYQAGEGAGDAGAGGGGGCDGGFSFGVPDFTTAFTGLMRI